MLSALVCSLMDRRTGSCETAGVGFTAQTRCPGINCKGFAVLGRAVNLSHGKGEFLVQGVKFPLLAQK